MSRLVALAVVSALAAAGEPSLVARPMHLEESPPPVRAARHVLLRYRGSPGGRPGAATQRTPEDAVRLARDLVARARAGEDLERIAAEHSEDGDSVRGGVLGSFVQGALAPELDRFLFSAEEGEVSDPIQSGGCVHVVQRIDAHAAVLQIFVRGSGDEARTRCRTIADEIRAGADFGEIARKRSEDPDSAARGGELAIYERGAEDTLLKAAAFRLRTGEVSAPVQSPLGWHLLKRVPVAEVDPALLEPSFVRLRGILVRTGDARKPSEAFELAKRLHERLSGGEDMRRLAREVDEDPGGKEREGDLGWIHRHQAGLSPALRRACLLQVGEVAEVQPVPPGYVILRREK